MLYPPSYSTLQSLKLTFFEVFLDRKDYRKNYRKMMKSLDKSKPKKPSEPKFKTKKPKQTSKKISQPIRRFLRKVMSIDAIDLNLSGWEMVPGISEKLLKELASISLGNGYYESEDGLSDGLSDGLVIVFEIKNRIYELSQESLEFIKLYIVPPLVLLKIRLRIPLKALGAPEGHP